MSLVQMQNSVSCSTANNVSQRRAVIIAMCIISAGMLRNKGVSRKHLLAYFETKRDVIVVPISKGSAALISSFNDFENDTNGR